MIPTSEFQVFVEGQYIGKYTLHATFDKRLWHAHYLSSHFFCPECAKIWCTHVSSLRPVHRPNTVVQRHCPRHTTNEVASIIPDQSRVHLYLDNFPKALLEYEFILRTKEPR